MKKAQRLVARLLAERYKGPLLRKDGGGVEPFVAGSTEPSRVRPPLDPVAAFKLLGSFVRAVFFAGS